MDTILSATASHREEIFIARQSILDRGQNLRAFELLFRANRDNWAEVSNATASTATTISHTLNELGVGSVLGGYRGYINFDTEMLMCDSIELLPCEKVVLEILETVEPTKRVIDRCRELRDLGFTLAMDDFGRYDEALRPLLELVHIVKVDLQLFDHAGWVKLVEQLRPFKVQLLAEKVDSVDQFDICLNLGFDLFQGYYFAKPEIIQGKRLSKSEMMLIRILGMLMADADMVEIEQVFKQDPGLSVNLLRLVNSVATGVKGKVSSLGTALIVLGQRQVQRWLQLLLFAQLSPCKEFPSPLLQLAACRGKFLELLAAGDKMAEDTAFMTGIMSLMDALLGMPLAKVTDGLPMPVEMRNALFERKGTLGRMLMLAEALENGDAPGVSAAIAAMPGYTSSQINLAQMQALCWANSIAQPSVSA